MISNLLITLLEANWIFLILSSSVYFEVRNYNNNVQYYVYNNRKYIDSSFITKSKENTL
jgi:hypothetical protein